MNICKKICNECPFRKTSLNGWLGHHDVEDIIKMQQNEYPFSCHMQRTDETTLEDVIVGDIDVCRGFLASASESSKLYGQHPVYGQALRALQNDITDEDKKIVMNKWDFKEHHSI